MGKHLLVVDWDYFFRNPLGCPPAELPDSSEWAFYDWGHRETLFFIHAIWGTRAAAFLHNGRELPGLTGEQRGFWARFRFAPDAKLYHADSNVRVVSEEIYGSVPARSGLGAWDSVWLYDAHHDSGYAYAGLSGATRRVMLRNLLEAGTWTCENWMLLYGALGARLHVRYPRWKTWWEDAEPKPPITVEREQDDGSTPDVEFSCVYVCRSGAWVPPWLDSEYITFLTDGAEALGNRFESLEPAGSRDYPYRPFSRGAAQDEADSWAELMRDVEAARAAAGEG